MKSTEKIWQELRNLKYGYDDLRKEIAIITSKKNDATQTSRRGALTSSGVTAERILKHIYRREGKEIGGKPADKLMLDELISELSERTKPSLLPPHMIPHLRTVQAWRNLGGHDKGDFGDVNDDTLIAVSIALNAVVSWFFESYLGGEFAELGVKNEINIDSVEVCTVFTENERQWQDYFWFVNRNENIRAIESTYLKSLQVKYKIPDERIQKIKSGFQRNIAEFKELIEQALEDGRIEIFEAEAIEHSREMCCISVAEAKELIIASMAHRKMEVKNAGNFQIHWIDEIIAAMKDACNIPEMVEQNNDIVDIVAVSSEDVEFDLNEIMLEETIEFDVVIDDEYVTVSQTDTDSFVINFNYNFLHRLDFDFTISYEKISINSNNTRVLITQYASQLSAIKLIGNEFWIDSGTSETRNLNQGTGINILKIAIPSSNGQFYPDWKKNLMSKEEDKDILIIIERYPDSKLEFGFNIQIGKSLAKHKLQFGNYSLNEL